MLFLEARFHINFRQLPRVQKAPNTRFPSSFEFALIVIELYQTGTVSGSG